MLYSFWFLIGVVGALRLILYANRFRKKSLTKLFGISLLVAAVIYVGFAIIWGDSNWLAVESLGVLFYGLFYWLAVRYSLLWLALGWSMHVIWDVGLHLLGPGHHVAPEWYAVACLSFDLVVAGYIVYRARID